MTMLNASSRRFRTGFPHASLLLAALVPLSAATADAPPPTSSDPAPPAKTARQILDERYVVGPTAGDLFGYRIVWQTEPLATAGSAAQCVRAGRDSIWFADNAGSVVRVRRDSGETVWRASTHKGIEKVLDIQHLPLGSDDRVYVVTEINLVALDALTGSLVRRSPFGQLPTTKPAVFHQYLISGTRNGLVAWYQYSTGFAWRATTIGGTIHSEPTVVGDIVLAGSSSGTVLALEAGTTRVLWDRRLSAGVEARIAADSKAAFVAGRDQSLWAFDLARGRVLWHYFTQSQLLHDPARIADGLYLQIPGEGLVSFNPHPTDKPEGEVRWKANVSGDVIGRLGPSLLVWDKDATQMSFVDAGNGRIVSQMALPQVMSIECTPRVNGDLFVCSTDGRVERLEPLARPSVPAERESGDGAPTDAASHEMQATTPAATPTPAPGEDGSRVRAEDRVPEASRHATSPPPRFSARPR
jgi:outer membrane protein assembly factor BamB